MQTQYSKGDAVRSNVDAQGMKRGERYVVEAVAVRNTMFGGFVTYTLRAADGTVVQVGNGHLVLAPAVS